MKKIAVLLIIAVFVFTSALQAAGRSGSAQPSPPAPAPVQVFVEPPPEMIMVNGILTTVYEAVSSWGVTLQYIDLKSSHDGATLTFTWSPNVSYIMDSSSGKQAVLSDRENDSVVVWYAVYDHPAMTNPEIPLAQAIIINVTQDCVLPVYSRVESLNRSNGSIEIITDRGNMAVVIDRDAKIAPFFTLTGKEVIITIDDVIEGNELFIWYTAITEGSPARAKATRAALLGRYATAISEVVAFNPGEVYKENGVLMAPLRPIAEATGWALLWDGEKMSVTLKKDAEAVTLVIGEEYGSGWHMFVPVIRNGMTYVSERFITDVFKLIWSENIAGRIRFMPLPSGASW